MKRSFLDRLHIGPREAGRQTPSEQEVRQALLSSGLFDSEAYRAAYPDVDKAGIDPLTHYLSWGHIEGRSPSQKFDTAAYLAANPDVAKAGFEPLTHYVLHGQIEGRKTPYGRAEGRKTPSEQELRQALLSSGVIRLGEAYRAAYPDVAKAGIRSTDAHYLSQGHIELGATPRRNSTQRLISPPIRTWRRQASNP